MAETYIVYSVTAVILLILSAKLEVIIKYNGQTVFEIRYILISVFLKADNKKGRRKKRRRSNTASCIKSLISRFISRAELDIRSLVITVPYQEPHIFSVVYKNLYDLINVTICGFGSRFHKYKQSADALKLVSGQTLKLSDAHFIVSTRLFYVLVHLTRHLFDSIKKKNLKRAN